MKYSRWSAIAISTLLSFLLASAVFAGEGMWLLTQLKDVDLAGQGIELTPEEIYSPTGLSLTSAVVNLSGSSAAFVSPQGLILTNHHVAFSAIQEASLKGTDYLTQGFIASSIEEEIPAPSAIAQILTEIRDVTEEVLAAGEKIKDPLKRNRMIDLKIQAIVDSERAKGEDVDARVAELYSGGLYQLYVYKKLSDVRLVFAPPESIGDYGGEVDNWIWPRHTGDFTYLRAYVSPDGIGREYDPENVPYQPERWFKISTSDLNDGDITFILGFPGKTDRYTTSYDVRYYRDIHYPYSIDKFQETIDLIEGTADGSQQMDIKIAGRTKYLYNGMKKYKGVIAGMYADKFLEEKTAYDEALQNFVNNDRKLKKKYGKVLPGFEKYYEDKLKTLDRDRVLGSFGYGGPRPVTFANTVYLRAKEMEKPEEERDQKLTGSGFARMKMFLRFSFSNTSVPIERVLLTDVLQTAVELPADQRIKTIDKYLEEKGSVEALVSYLLDGTKMMDPQFAMPLMDMNTEEIEAIDDPIVQFVIALYPEMRARDDKDDRTHAEVKELRRQYMEMIEAKDGVAPYPDATRTIRLTTGVVQGYSPRDAVWYEPFTTLKGVIEKDTGEVPFNMPQELRQLEEQKDFGIWADPKLGDIPVAFTHICDITGGNSGSAVLNARGEMIGLAFDGNFEALLGDWKFDPEINRTISVDIRYVMFLTEKYAKANRLLDEMGLAHE